MDRFPENFGIELAGLSFDEIFKKHPKWIACVSELWTDNCTGLFKKFRNYVMLRLKDDLSRIEHEQRCYKFVQSLGARKEIPVYLIKYSNARRSTDPDERPTI